jgi:hypothetical protein
MRKWSTLLLAIWLIAIGVITILEVSFNGLASIMAILEITAGIFLILGGKNIKVFHHLGALLLAIWLITQGIFLLFGISFNGLHIIMGILAIVAGILLPMGKGKKKLIGHIGTIALTVWLILTGILMLFSTSFSGSAIILSILAIVAGFFLIIKK